MDTSQPSRPKEEKMRVAKVVLLGESAVGKSSIANRFTRNEFSPIAEATIGAAFLSRTVTVPPPSGDSVKFEIWDTAGQERFRSLAPLYYRSACGALVVYDITSADSLRKAQTWIRELRVNADLTITIFLLGNKSDLESLRQVTFEEGAALAKEEGVSGFFETSAKENSNIDDVFVELARTLLEHGLAALPTGGVRGARGAKRLEPPARAVKEENKCSC